MDDARLQLEWLDVDGEAVPFASGTLDLTEPDWQVEALAPASWYMDEGEYAVHARAGTQEVWGRAQLVTSQLPDGELFIHCTRIGDAP